jgi:hypothetical protein
MSKCTGCSSRGCSTKQRIENNWDKPCTCGGSSQFCHQRNNPDRYTQGKSRPIDASPAPIKDIKRPQRSGDFSQVLFQIQKNDMILVVVHYKDVHKFKGNKLFIYKKEVWNNLKEEHDLTKIDPHFYEDNKSPIARICPNNEGIQLVSFILKLSVDEINILSQNLL